MPYYVYLAKCKDGTYYCGYTKNLEKRLKQHNTSKKGAKYTRGKRPITLEYWEEYENLSTALKREFEIKKLPRLEKKKLINQH